MYKTNYFEDINVDSIKASIVSFENASASLRNASAQLADLFANSTEWEGESKNTLISGFDKVNSTIDKLKDKFSYFETALKIASQIKELQEQMESLTDVAALNNFATMIQEYLVQFKTNIISMASITDDSDSNPSLSPSLMGSDGFASGVFRINPEKFRVAKDSFTEWSEMLKANYDSYLSLQGYLSSDSYLNYAWGLACQTFDNLVKKRDNIDNWVEGFITNIVEIEASLPENVKGVSDVETTSFLQNHDYPTEPSFEDYKKSGQSGNISTSKSKNSSKKSSKKSSSNKYTNTSKKHSTGGGTTTTSSSSGVSGTTSKSGGSSKKTKINSKNTKTGYQNAIAKATKKAAKQAKDKKLKTNYQNAQASAKRTIQTKKAKTNYQNAQASVKKTVENKKIKTNYQNAQKKAKTSTTARPTTTSAPTTTRQSWIKKTFFSPPKSGPSFAPGVAGGNR